MRDTFETSLGYVLDDEGGWADSPNDKPTMKGITLDTYSAFLRRKVTKQELRNIPDDHVRTIYRQEYWDRISGDELPRGIDYFVFDYAVNSGPLQAIRTLQKALQVSTDGLIGPITLGAAKKANASTVIEKMYSSRMKFLQGLSKWKYYGDGWTRRVDGVRKNSLALSRIVTTDIVLKPQAEVSGTTKGMITMGTYAKAITAFLTSLVGVIALFIPGVEQYVTPEIIAVITMVINTVLVYIIPNKITPVQVEASRSAYGTSTNVSM